MKPSITRFYIKYGCLAYKYSTLLARNSRFRSTPDNIQFTLIKDDSYLSHYLRWETSEVTLAAIDATHTKVTWKLFYKRILDPFWYFWPLQNYLVKLAANELINNVAVPHA